MTLLQSYEQLRGKIYARRERMLEEREAGKHISVFFGTLWLVLMELRSIVLRFLILNFSDPAESFKILLRLKPEDVCTYSYCSYRYLKNRVQILSFAGTSMIVIGSVVGTFLLSIILPLLALRAQTVNWDSKLNDTRLQKNNLFTLNDWQRGHFFGTTLNNGVIELASGPNYGTGSDGVVTVDQPNKLENIIATSGECTGKRVASRISIFDLEDQAVTLRRSLSADDCIFSGTEVAILYFAQEKNKEIFIGYDTNYVQGIRGRRLLLDQKFVAKPASIAYLVRVPQLTELQIGAHGALKDAGVVLVRAKVLGNHSRSPLVNLANATISNTLGSWLSPIYEINTINSFAQKIAWEGTSAVSRDVRILVASSNNPNALQWDNEEVVGCTSRTPCKLSAQHFGKRYIQCKVILSKDSGDTPHITSLSVQNNVGYASEPTLVGVLNYHLLGMQVLSPDVPNVLVQVRAGKTLQELRQAPWCGFESCGLGDFFDVHNLKQTIALDHELQRHANRWFQYRIFSANPNNDLSRSLVRNIKLRLQSTPNVAVGKF